MSEIHFTYKSDINQNVLAQGDVLSRTDDLCDLIGKYHTHYKSSEYTHFQILTQSCDLVRRGTDKKCSSRYITLAAVRSLDTVLKRAIEKEAEKRIELEGNIYCSDIHKERLSSVLESLFNNNAKDYFFLKSLPEKGLYEDSCTFLYLSIAIKAHEHYDLCLKAKRLELSENFRSKLGWMVGNLYSRVGTEDYVPGALPEKDLFRELINLTLEKYLAWVPKEAFPEFKKVAKPELTFDEICEKAQKELDIKKMSKINNLASSLKQACNLNSDQLQNLKEFLESGRGSKLI